MSHRDATPNMSTLIPTPIHPAVPPWIAELRCKNGISVPKRDMANEIMYVINTVIGEFSETI